MDFAKGLDRCEDFGSIFNLVKKSVEKAIERRREGLMIALQYLPEGLGAYYGVGTNLIVMNKTLLEKIRLIYDERASKAYIFSVLMHEYLHSLGFLDEGLVQDLSYQICKMTLGESHLSTKIAKLGIGAFIPESARGIRIQEKEEIEILDTFEMDSITYIG